MPVISTNNFKNGTHIEVDGQVFRIVEFQHVKPGKGRRSCAASSRTSAPVRSRQDLPRRREGALGPHRDAQDAVPLRVRRRGRADGPGDYEQISLPKSIAGDSLDWMIPNDEVDVLFVDGSPATCRCRAPSR